MKLHLNMFKKTALIAGMTALMTVGTASAGEILNSPHDTRSASWNNTGEICIVCHTPHIMADRTQTFDAPLWNHEITTASFTMYDTTHSTTLDGTVDPSPSGPSLLCLSCHDGTVGMDAFGGNTGAPGNPGPGPANPIPPGFRLGTDLRNDHPISITFNDTTAGADGALFPPTTTETTIGEGGDQRTGMINDVMLYDGKVQCPSCHDVHNKFTILNTKLLKRSNVASALCRTCHDK